MPLRGARPRTAIGRSLAGRLPLLSLAMLLLATAALAGGDKPTVPDANREEGDRMLKEITLCVALFGSTAGCSQAAGALDDRTATTDNTEMMQSSIDGSDLPSEERGSRDLPLPPGIQPLPEPDPPRRPPTSAPAAQVSPMCDGFSVGDVLFDSGQAELTEAGLAALAQFAAMLPTGARIAVDGHTDDKPIAIGNQRLSEMRAANVATALEESLGDGIVIGSVSGWGETKPIAENTTVDGRSRNRRVEIDVSC